MDFDWILVYFLYGLGLILLQLCLLGTMDNLAILSPFDEQEEWHKISEILNSFGTNLGADVKESTTPNNCMWDAKATEQNEQSD